VFRQENEESDSHDLGKNLIPNWQAREVANASSSRDRNVNAEGGRGTNPVVAVHGNPWGLDADRRRRGLEAPTRKKAREGAVRAHNSDTALVEIIESAGMCGQSGMMRPLSQRR
jgi:hypothetical protein